MEIVLRALTRDEASEVETNSTPKEQKQADFHEMFQSKDLLKDLLKVRRQ